jgi:uncharacterized protein
MKLQPDRSDAQTISAYGPGWVGVGSEKITHSVVIGSRGQRIAWAARFEDLGPEHFEVLAGLQVEVVIFGSGSRIRFPRPAWIAPLAQRRGNHGHRGGLPHLQHPGAGRARGRRGPAARGNPLTLHGRGIVVSR